MNPSPIKIGTRGSKLALIQTEWVIEHLRTRSPGIEFRPEVITTSGDRSTSEVRGDGVFVKEIQRALMEKQIDLAVHSLKDLPTDPVDGIVVGAIPIREDPSEALIGAALAALADGARVGTGSPRRTAQLRALRPDLEILSIRGNVPTRIEKVRNGDYDAVLLANAGLRRLGVQADEVIAPTKILPAPGQGALAVEARADDEELLELLSAIDDQRVRSEVTAEREVLRNLGGGCLLPVGAFGRIVDGSLLLDAAVAAADGSAVVHANDSGPARDHSEIAWKVSNRLRTQGALKLLESEGANGFQ